jgi:uncharacterized phage protein gp47/JayE
MLAVHVINAGLDTIAVVASIRTAAGFTPATVAAAVIATIRNYINPLTWAPGAPLRHNEFVSVIDQVPGVDYVVSVTLNAGSGDVAATTPKALPQAGTVTVTEAP